MSAPPKGLFANTDGVKRCWWCSVDPLYIAYHDSEWGFPNLEDRYLFEKLCLEGFQCGLSWLTILRKRQNLRAAFEDFNIQAVATYTKRNVNKILKDEGGIRHRGKVESAINNAQRAIDVIEEFGSLAAYLWQFEPPAQARRQTLDWPTLARTARTEHSIALSKDLKKRGWTYVGPTTMYAFMQAVGMVNDHLTGCVIRNRAETAWRSITRPQARRV
jgi:DNA-3-methyladenine glycosylase I